MPSGKLPDSSSSDSDAVKPQTFSAPQTTDDRDAATLSVSLLHFANRARYSRDDSSTSLVEGSLVTLTIVGHYLAKHETTFLVERT